MKGSSTTTRYVSSAPPLVPADTAPKQIGEIPRAIRGIEPLQDPSMGGMRYQSPFRYPGAKSGLSAVIAELISSASKSIGQPRLFVEPFAGGASTALRLAGTGAVERILLADIDPLVARFWQVAAADTDWLIDRMWSEPVTLERWDYWRAWRPVRSSDRDIAMKCLFLNRTTFSGILHGRAGPIGGRRQESAFKIDCRFTKKSIERRIRFVGDLYKSNRLVDVWCKDWHTTLANVAEWYPQLLPNQIIAYLDPPYLERSARLYGRSFDVAGGYASRRGQNPAEWIGEAEHYRLAEYLRRKAQYRWLLSYDNHPALTNDFGLYAARRMTPSVDDRDLLNVRTWRISRRLVNLRYTVANNGPAQKEELLITTLPSTTVPINERFRIVAGPK